MKLFLFILYYFICSLACYAADILDSDDCSSDTEIIDCETFPLHFIWIGPPTKDTSTSMIGHDVVGPASIAHQLRLQNAHHSMTFWCLSQFYDYYHGYFSNEAPEITVQPLDSYMDEGIQKNDQALLELHEAFKKIDNQENIDIYSIIMKNTLKKNGFSIYLLTHNYGYIMDTNLYPLNVLRPDLPMQINLFDFESVTTMKGCSGYDYFCMFSPKALHPIALDFFKLWLSTPWMYNFPSKTRIEKKPFLHIDIGLIKISFKSYFNSHKKISDFCDDNNFPLFKLLMDYFFSIKAVDELEKIEEKCYILLTDAHSTINQQPTNCPYLKLLESHSLLHHCIAHNNQKAIEYLRSKGFFENLKALYWCSLNQQQYFLSPGELERFLITHARPNF